MNRQIQVIVTILLKDCNSALLRRLIWKNNLLIVLAVTALAALVAGCSFTVPKKMSLRTNAEYNFTAAEFNQSLKEYIGVKKIQEQLPPDSNIKVYDYNPGGNCPDQHFLVKVPLMSYPIDMASYIKNLTMDGLSFEQKFTVPEVKIEKEVNIPLSELSDKVKGDIQFFGKFNEKPACSLEVSAEMASGLGFSSIEYEAGSLDIYVAKADLGAYAVINNDYGTFASFDELSEPKVFTLPEEYTAGIPGAEELKFTANYVAHIDLAGFPISATEKMNFSFDGIDFEDSVFEEQFFVAEIPESAVIKSVSGVTLNETVGGLETQYFPLDFGDFAELEIGEAKLKIDLKLPETWTNSKLDLKYNVKLEDEEWITDGIGGVEEIIKDKKLSAGILAVTPELSLNIENGKISIQDPVTIKVSCSVDKINSIALDKSVMNLDELLNFAPIPLPSEITSVVSKIQLGESTIKVTSKSTLPAGNDIEFGLNSSFLQFDNQKAVIKGGGEEHTDELTSSAFADYKATAGAEIDIAPSIKLPNESGTKFSLAGIEPGKEYSISINAVPEIKLEKVAVDTSGIPADIKSDENGLDTGLEFSTLLSGMGEDVSKMLEKISFAELPVYLYTNSGVEAFENIGIEGTIEILNDETSVKLLDNGKITFGNEAPELKDDEIMTEALSANATIPHADISGLLSFQSQGSLKVKYDLKVTGKESSEIEIEAAKIPDSANLEVTALVDLPLKLKVAEGGFSLNIMDLIAKDSSDEGNGADKNGWEKDLLGRTEPMDLGEAARFLEAVKSASVKLTSSKLPVATSGKDGICIKVDLDPESGAGNPLVLDLEEMEIKLSKEQIKGILEKPFAPGVTLELPEGELSILRDMDLKTRVDLQLVTDGTVELWKAEN